MNWTVALAVVVLGAGEALAQGRGDLFRRFPFEQWRAAGSASQIKWQFHMTEASLSPHQRLLQRFEGLVDAGEVQKRRDHGQILFLLELEDASGRRWRTREMADLSRIPADFKSGGVSWAQDAFVLPGKYRVSVAVFDTKTQEHSFLTRELRVAGPKSDPLAQAEQGLPTVEFVRQYAQPDAWFQPGLRASVALPVASKRPVHIDIVMNMTMSERVQGSLRAFRRNMSLLIPCLRVLAAMQPEQGAIDVTLLDLAKKKMWQQEGVRGLDWEKMRDAFATTNPGVIDVASLAGKGATQQYFWDSLLARVMPEERKGDEALRVVIVLSSPLFLERQYKVEPATVPKDPNRRVYYLQYRPLQPRPAMMHFEDKPMPAAMAMPSDDLERTLKLLDAKVFSVVSPAQFRKALAVILADIGKL